ncbi:AhpD-like protein [Podospora australis]|uniref:AhpD-like protein n=1 Tax=Podospora australis TaxID=1536484 RepID=A0AAN7AJ90_9PEZI|nr:AhpD-like protein [Podospora australis]
MTSVEYLYVFLHDLSSEFLILRQFDIFLMNSSVKGLCLLIPKRAKPCNNYTPFVLNQQIQTRKMRLPYVPNPPPPSTEEEDAIVKRIQERRAPRPLQPLDLTLLHSPPVADGWNSFLGAIRTKTTIPEDLKEIAISRVAVVNRAWYEWAHHAPLAEKGGVSKEGMEAVKDGKELILGETEMPGGLTEKQWAVVCFTDEMTRNVQVRDETFGKMKELFGEREVVEIVATIACYNCVSRFLVALDVGERNGTGPDAAH